MPKSSESDSINSLPVGFSLTDWQPRSRPPNTPMRGRSCTVEPLDVELHAKSLYDAYIKDTEHRVWTYMAYGPFTSFNSYHEWLCDYCTSDDPMFHAVVDADSERALGVASYLRIEPQVGVIEVGHINFSPQLQKTRMATEAMFLMMQRVFDELGYRRYEWKCDALNARSCAAAIRLGFTFEGIFRQATIYKNRNRDTAWYSMIDKEWPALKAAYLEWLDEENFDDQENQRATLAELINRTKGE